MKLNELAPAAGATKTAKRVGRGRGSGSGRTSGRGEKGQKSRAGSSLRPFFEGGQMPLQRRIPKRGFKNLFRQAFAVVNVGALDKHFQTGAVVDEAALRKAGLVKKNLEGIKLLGEGEVTKSLMVKVARASKSAVAKIVAAGGQVETELPESPQE